MKIATPPPATDAPAPAAPALVGTTDQPASAPDDFMALLTQLVSASATATATQTSAQGTAIAADEKDDDTDADAVNLLPIAIPITQIELPKDVVVANADTNEGIEALLGTMAKGENTAQATQMLDAALSTTKDADTKPSEPQTTAPAVTFADALATHRPTPSATDAPAQPAVTSPVGSPQWREEVGARVSLMVQQGNHSASLKLSPEHLGPMEVRISVQNDQASVWFGAAHADTRAAIEHALPRLRELFASQGLSLADAGVFREPPREQPKQGSFNGSSSGEGSSEPQTVQTLMIKRLGLVDAYA
jgi:flagellar hook-length control protein FliK